MPPYKSDGTSAIADRMMFLVFNNMIPENKRDKTLLDKLLSEGSRTWFVKWAVKGLQALRRNKLVFVESAKSIQFKRNYLSEINNVPGFIGERCNVDLNNLKLKVQRKYLYPAYKNYCIENGLRVCSDTDFYGEVEKLGFSKSKIRMYGSTGLIGYRGIELKEEYITTNVKSSSTSSTEGETH